MGEQADEEATPERRVNERHPLITFAWWSSIMPPEHGVAPEGLAQVFDVSAGGAGIITADALTVDDLIYLALRTTKGSMGCVVRVMHCRPDGAQFRVGVQFVVLSPADRSTLRKLVADE